jgi:hypothetical protein
LKYLAAVERSHKVVIGLLPYLQYKYFPETATLVVGSIL